MTGQMALDRSAAALVTTTEAAKTALIAALAPSLPDPSRGR
jgi:hypothetical protein